MEQTAATARERRQRRIAILRQRHETRKDLLTPCLIRHFKPKNIRKRKQLRELRRQQIQSRRTRLRVFYTVVGQWTVLWAQMVFLHQILPHLSSNFPLDLFQTKGFDPEIWKGVGCVWMLVSLGSLKHPRVHHPGLQPAYAHHVVMRAFGFAVPQIWLGATAWGIELSHQCEAWWRGYLLSQGYEAGQRFPRFGKKLINPAALCITPLHLRQETHESNLVRAGCFCSWQGGCTCESNPPCWYPTAEEQQGMVTNYIMYLTEWFLVDY